jgi:predicted transcriptional regulator
MAFKGTLREFKVPDILQLISLQKKTGILTFNSLEGFITLIFEDGCIVGIDAFPKKLEMRVGNVLVKQEIISSEMLQRALAIQKRTNQKVGEILIGMGLIDEKIIPEMLKIQAVQIVLSLFNWKKGDYNFKVLDKVNKDLRLLNPIAVDTLIMEGVQMLDEWPLIKKVIPNEDIIFEPVYLGSKKIELVSEYDDDRSSKDGNTIFLSDIELNLLKYINGTNKVKDLVEMGLFTEYKIYKKLYNLFNKGLMKKKEKSETQEIQEKKLIADLHSSNNAKLRQLFNFFLALLAMLLLLTFSTPLRPVHKKNTLRHAPFYRQYLRITPPVH